MRLSAELIGSCEQRTNPLGEREIVLRGMAIPAIEHLAVTRDAFDTMDFTENRLSALDNFPKLTRLKHLLAAQNFIDSLDAANIAQNIPQLQFLEVSHNQISSLLLMQHLGKACLKLEHLNLTGNPVTRRQHYRLYTIKNIPSLKVLDYQKISKTERERAERLAQSAAGAALESDVQAEGLSGNSNNNNNPSNTKTFIPGEGLDPTTSFHTMFTPEEKEQIRNLIANASSATEMDEIESYVQRGILPPQLAAAAAATEGSESKKREASNYEPGTATEEAPASKKIRTEEEGQEEEQNEKDPNGTES